MSPPSYVRSTLMASATTMLLLLTSVGSRAQTPPTDAHPLFLPTRDVAITYSLRTGANGQTQTTHLYYTAAQGGQLRIDTPNGAGYTVLDRAHNQQMMVISAQRIYAVTTLPPGAADGFILNDQMDFVRQGNARVAGLNCVNWLVSSPGTSGHACVTDDGVLLSGDGHPTATPQGGPPPSETGLTALNVQYGAQPAGLFAPPQGFRRMTEQEMDQQMGAAGGGYPPPAGTGPGMPPPANPSPGAGPQ